MRSSKGNSAPWATEVAVIVVLIQPIIHRLPFQWITHLQGNPAEDETLMFCDQRGDWMIPQRMWLINTDGSGLRPLYDQRPEDWVTHECWSYDGTFVTFVLHPIEWPVLQDKLTGDKIDTSNLQLPPLSLRVYVAP